MDSLTLLTLLAELERVELQLNDTTLSHSDRHLLDQAWENLMNQIDDAEAAIDAAAELEQPEWTTLEEFFDEEVEDNRGCHNCAGCSYCQDEIGYDAAGEV